MDGREIDLAKSIEFLILSDHKTYIDGRTALHHAALRGDEIACEGILKLKDNAVLVIDVRMPESHIYVMVYCCMRSFQLKPALKKKNTS